MQEGTWQNVVMGADAPGVQARGTLQSSGPFLHAWIKFRLPNDPTVRLIHASIDVSVIEDALELEANSRPGMQMAMAGGRLGRRLKEKFKAVARKIAKNKLVQGLKKVVKKVINNPLVKGLISATPFGAAAMATAAAARIAAKAIKGGKKAVHKLKQVAAGAAQGDPDAIRQARLLKQGLAQLRLLRQLAPAVTAGMDEPQYLSQLLSGCARLGDRANLAAMGRCAQPQIGCAIPPLVGCGADGLPDETEIDAFETVATSGAFEGIRWLAHRARLHPMNPREFDKNDALYLGHQTMVQHALLH